MSSKIALHSMTPQAPTLVPISKRRWSLAMRLTMWYAGSTFAIVVATTAILYWAFVSNIDRQDDQFLIDEAHIIQDLLVERPEYIDAIRQEIEWEAAARRYAKVYERLLDSNGQTIVETPDMTRQLPVSMFPNPRDESTVDRGIDKLSLTGIPYRVISVNHSPGSADGVRTIQIAVDRVQQYELMAAYRLILIVVLCAALVASSLAAYLIAHRGIRPIVDVTATVRRIRSTTLHERIETGRFPYELSSLVDTFNEMLDRLKESFERLSRFSADIAHELRTPVNNLRGEAEVTLNKPRTASEYHESLASCLEESIRLSRIIDSLLLMARADSPESELQRETVDLSTELRQLHDFYEAIVAEANIAFIVEAVPDLRLSANRPLLQRAIGNLVENALAFTPSGGTIAVSVTRQKGRLQIEVADTGCGIPKENLPYVFGRFYRVEHDRSSVSGGSGLGLAIVRSITELHGGKVSIDSTPGRGTTVTMSLPLTYSGASASEDDGTVIPSSSLSKHSLLTISQTEK